MVYGISRGLNSTRWEYELTGCFCEVLQLSSDSPCAAGFILNSFVVFNRLELHSGAPPPPAADVCLLVLCARLISL